VANNNVNLWRHVGLLRGFDPNIRRVSTRLADSCNKKHRLLRPNGQSTTQTYIMRWYNTKSSYASYILLTHQREISRGNDFVCSKKLIFTQPISQWALHCHLRTLIPSVVHGFTYEAHSTLAWQISAQSNHTRQVILIDRFGSAHFSLGPKVSDV